MANTSEKHKLKKSQKRKERQLRRKERHEMREELKLQACIEDYENKALGNEMCKDGIEASFSRIKGSTKSLPGFLAKNVDKICQWLKDYFILFQKADDAQIDYFKQMSREARDKFIQDYVDMHDFIDCVKKLKEQALNKDISQQDVHAQDAASASDASTSCT